MTTQTDGQAERRNGRSAEQLLSAIRREAERSALRARNGIKLVTGRFPEPKRWITPHDVVWRHGRFSLMHYRSDHVRYRPPLLIVYSLANKSYVLDLAPGNSFVGRLVDAGLDVYLLDWGVPDERDASNTLNTYASEGIGDAIRVVQRESGQGEVNLFGYCFGGVLALLGLAANPTWPVRCLTVATVPLDWDKMDPAMTAAVRRGSFRVEDVLDDTGNVPASVVQQMFNNQQPLSVVTEYADLVESLWSDQYIQQYKVVAGWGHDQVPLAGAAARETMDLVVKNTLGTEGTFELGGRKVSLADIKVPFRSLIATGDTIVPNGASYPVCGFVGSADCEEIRVPGGHIGLFVGRGAHKRSIPKVLEFIVSVSDEVGIEHSAASDSRTRQ